MKKVIKIFLILCFTNSFASDSLEKRVKALEQGQYLLLKKSSPFSTFNAKNVTFGGYFNATYTQFKSKNHPVEQSFDEVELGMIIKANVNEDLSIFSHIEFEQEFGLENTHAPWRKFKEKEVQIEPEVIYLEYFHDKNFYVQFGAVIAPFGLSNLEHFDYFRLQNEKPLGLREKGDKYVFFSDHVNGLKLYKDFKFKSLYYRLYYYSGSNGLDNSSLVHGSRFELNGSSELYKFAVSYQQGKRSNDNSDRYESIGVDLNLRIKNIGFKAEYYKSNLKNYNFPEGYYFEPALYLKDDKIILFSRVDYINDTIGINFVDHDNNESTADIQDLYKKSEYTIGVNFLPVSSWRNSIAITKHVYSGDNKKLNETSRDYESFEVGTVLSF